MLSDPQCRVQDATSTYSWLGKGGPHNCLLLFANKADREHFINTFNTRAAGITLYKVALDAV